MRYSTKPIIKADPVSLIKHLDVSSVVFKPEARNNTYVRTPAYRKRKSIKIVGTNSECY
jgi:hypothetical protein